MSQFAIPFAQIRGGSSKGLYFNAGDLPPNETARNAVLVAAMGRGERQIDGLGGADPLTSKVAIVSRSERPGADIDYLFAQVVLGRDLVDTKPNCGNILAGVGVFALETGMVAATPGTTTIRIYMVNSDKTCELMLPTPNGRMIYEGNTKIDGVPGTASPILCNYNDLAGSACGSLLPTGNTKDVIAGIEVTCIDNGMPVAIITAESMGISGTETPAQLNADEDLCRRLRNLRLELGPKMNLGNVADLAVPKMCMVSRAMHGGAISTRTFIPDKCHSAIGVLGAVSVATACVLPGTVCDGLTQINAGKLKLLSIEHPSGEFTVTLETTVIDNRIQVSKAGVVRTARLLSRGELYVPAMLMAATTPEGN